jgi:hypothetical protein
MTIVYNLKRNVYENFSINLPDEFNQNLPPSGTIYAYLKFAYSIDMAVGSSEIDVGSSCPFVIPSPVITMVPTLTRTGPTVLALNSLASDSYCITNSKVFSNTDVYLATGFQKESSNSGFTFWNYYSSWFPFTVAIPQGQAIDSASLSVLCVKDSSDGGGGALACEASGNAVAPTDYNSQTVKVHTTAKTIDPGGAWVSGTSYTFDVTSTVQEVINRSDWVSGNNLAIMFYGVTDPNKNHCRYFQSYDGGGGPVLTITYTP